MTNTELIRRHVEAIDGSLREVAYLLDMEILAEDTRHFGSDIKSAQRELINLRIDELEEARDLRGLYDQLKRLKFCVRVIQNNLNRCEKAIDSAEESLNVITREVESANDSDADLDY